MINIIPTFRPIRKPICINRISLDYELWDLSPESYKSETYPICQGHGYSPCLDSKRHQVYHTDYKLVKPLNKKAKLYVEYRSKIYYTDCNINKVNDVIKNIRKIEDRLINEYNFPIINH